MTDTGSPAWPRCIFATSVPPHCPCMIQSPACLMHSGSSYLVQAPKAALCVGCNIQHTLVSIRLHQHPLCVLWEVLCELHPACTQTDLLSQAAHPARALLVQLSHSGAESAFTGAPIASKLCNRLLQLPGRGVTMWPECCIRWPSLQSPRAAQAHVHGSAGNTFWASQP